jgi:hypothetical protein
MFKFRVSEMPFPGFGGSLTEFCWSENSVLVCRNLQFSVLICRNLQFVYNLVVLNGRRRI